MAAKTAAESGLDVVLLEKRQEIGEPIRCAEGVSIRSELKELIDVEPSWISTEIQGARMHSPNGDSIFTTGVKGEGGGEVRDRVSAVSWTGKLPADQFDQFGIMMKIGAVSGPLYFPTTQLCEKGSIAWTTIPTEGQAWHMLKTPAPVLDISAAPAESHQHH